MEAHSDLLFSLPSEVRLIIFQMCDQLALRSLALCSKWVYKEVAPVLWENVKVSWTTLEENTTILRKSQHPSNLRFISCLKFHGDGEGELSIPEEQRGYLSYGFAYFIQACNPERIEWLNISDFMPANGLRMICDAFQNLQTLQIYFVQGNWAYLSYLPPSVKYLSLWNCDIHKEHLDVLCRMENLEGLEIPWCDCLVDDDFSSVKDFMLKNLQQLDLMCDAANDGFIAIVPKVCINLKRLKLFGTPLTDSGIACVAHISTLRDLNITSMVNITDVGIYFISKLPALESLCMTMCDGLSPDSLRLVGTMKTLKILLISGSCKDATDDDLVHVGNLKSLSALHIGEMPNLTNASLELISTLEHLEHLNVNQCLGFTDDGLVHLTKLPRLRVLRMSIETNLTEEGLELCGLKHVLDKGERV